MSLISKLRKAMNKASRQGESVKISDDGEDRMKVVLTVHRMGCYPPMTGTLNYETHVSGAQCRVIPGGLPAIAALLWGKIRASEHHPDHPQSVYQVTLRAAEATGLSPAEVAAEIVVAMEQEQLEGRDAAIATARLAEKIGLEDAPKKKLPPYKGAPVSVTAHDEVGVGLKTPTEGGGLPDTGKDFTVPGSPPKLEILK